MNQTPERLGRYHVSDRIGGGPTGEVFRAKVYGVAGMNRDFAVKRFHPGLVRDETALAAISMAARLYGALEHPRIAKLHEFATVDGSTFAAAAYVEGLDLGQLTASESLPVGTAARLIVQVGRAVGYAHGRGLSHLGLCPTNVICNKNGDIKVTDFGFLPNRLPAAPADDSSIAARIPFLAPEQLEGQRTSPATDVYQLGTLAYWLMVGKLPYAGRTATDLASAMLTQPVPDSGLPAPYQKLFQRAMARSAFERYPDTGAMVDALEAALRTSPVAGREQDAGAIVHKRLSQLAQAREQEASGILSFPIPSPPPDDLAQPVPNTTLLGQAAPIPGPTGGAPAAPIGMGASPVALGSQAIDRRQDTFSEAPTIARAPLEEVALGPAGTHGASTGRDFIGGASVPAEIEQPAVSGHPTSAPSSLADGETLDDSETLIRDAEQIPESASPYPEPSDADGDVDEEEETAIRERLSGDADDVLSSLELVEDSIMAPLPAQPVNGLGAPSQRLETLASKSPLRKPPLVAKPAPKKSSQRTQLLAVIGIAGLLLVGGYVVFGGGQSQESESTSPAGKPAVAAQTDASSNVVAQNASLADAGTKVVAASDAVKLPPPDGSMALAVASATPDAAMVPDATGASATPPPPETGSSNSLEIRSRPEGAKVYIDGTLAGKTPISLDSSPDQHRLALILPGYDLEVRDISGYGIVQVDLNEVTPLGGPAGIKVRCKAKNRYYVYVDGHPEGQLCPSERIGVSKGRHVVEIYDPVTDSRRAFKVQVKDTRLSLRVRVD